MTIRKLDTRGNQATVEAVQLLEKTGPGPDGASHRMSIERSTRDTWLKSGGAWKLKSMEMLDQKIMRDGNPVGPPPSGRR